MNVLVIAPHPDDEAIGCGGAICLHAEADDQVTVVFLTSGELGLKHLPEREARQVREGEAECAAEQLGVHDIVFLRQPDWLLGAQIAVSAAALRPVIERTAPHVIYAPHAQEAHPDHRAALPLLSTASHGLQLSGVDVLTYEVWTPLTTFERVLNIGEAIDRKIAAIRCYPSQLEQFRYDAAARGLNEFRGALAGCGVAEVFKPTDLRRSVSDPAALEYPPHTELEWR